MIVCSLDQMKDMMEKGMKMKDSMMKTWIRKRKNEKGMKHDSLMKAN